ncbi:cyanophycinase [Nibribacter ruber]|uniref:Cyanophycinase n=1 Tax=Nibribacter ruber TaxID=2698458 RepID=A0A6P1NWY4_9BACT|nr:cyanophycinase [Nibribacter ruber]QHL87540.1 cyanophycinase [Nibribacter ruber]
MQKPKGKIVAIGGNEDKGTYPSPAEEHLQTHLRFFDHGILKRIHDELHGLGTRIEVITSASHIPEQMGQLYLDAFLKLGCDNVGVLYMQHSDTAQDDYFLERIKKADGLMFTGGDQRRISEVFLGSPALELLKQRYQQEEKFLISGTSAGAMALSKIMIEESRDDNALVKGMVRLQEGMGLLEDLVIDTHFVNRRRMPRLIEAISAYPSHVGIGLGEDTGILIRENECIETIGSGLVVVIDGRHLEENNFTQIEQGEPLCLEHLLLHVLPKGRRYNLVTGEFMDEVR